MRYNTNGIAKPIAELTPFTTNGAVYGVSVENGLAVYSYAEPIALFDAVEKIAYLNATKYSNTTSRHQSAVRAGVRLLEQEAWKVEEMIAQEFTEVTSLPVFNRNPYYLWQ